MKELLTKHKTKIQVAGLVLLVLAFPWLAILLCIGGIFFWYKDQEAKS